MNEKLKAPEGYASWLEYAVATMSTRDLHLFSIGDSHWGRIVRRDEMRQAANNELTALTDENKRLREALEKLCSVIQSIQKDIGTKYPALAEAWVLAGAILFPDPSPPGRGGTMIQRDYKADLKTAHEEILKMERELIKWKATARELNDEL
ncbi:MAG: hypothetical protein KKD77_24325, partial [Gammaproteobacteria bacterium]|nr:hypothetical protein [Gammaproteobacteria bacterium]